MQLSLFSAESIISCFMIYQELRKFSLAGVRSSSAIDTTLVVIHAFLHRIHKIAVLVTKEPSFHVVSNLITAT